MLSKILEDIDPILRDGIRSSLTIGRIIGIDLISKYWINIFKNYVKPYQHVQGTILNSHAM